MKRVKQFICYYHFVFWFNDYEVKRVLVACSRHIIFYKIQTFFLGPPNNSMLVFCLIKEINNITLAKLIKIVFHLIITFNYTFEVVNNKSLKKFI